MAATATAKHAGENIMNKIHHKHCSAFRWLFIYYGPDLCTEDGTCYNKRSELGLL